MIAETTLRQRHRSLNDFTHIDFQSSFGDINLMNRNTYQHIIQRNNQNLPKDIPTRIGSTNALITYEDFEFETELTLNTEEHNKFGVRIKRDAVNLEPKTITLTLKVLDNCNDVNYIIENIRHIISENIASLRQKSGAHLPHTSRIVLTNNQDWFLGNGGEYEPYQTNLRDIYFLDAYPISVSTDKQTIKKEREIVIEFNCPKPAFYKEKKYTNLKPRLDSPGLSQPTFFWNEGDISTDYQMEIKLNTEPNEIRNRDYNYHPILQISSYMDIYGLTHSSTNLQLQDCHIYLDKKAPVVFFDLNAKRKYGSQIISNYLFQSIDGAQNYYGLDNTGSLSISGNRDMRDDFYKSISQVKKFKQWWAFDISFLISPTSHHINGFYKQLPPRTPMYISKNTSPYIQVDIWFNEYYLL